MTHFIRKHSFELPQYDCDVSPLTPTAATWVQL